MPEKERGGSPFSSMSVFLGEVDLKKNGDELRILTFLVLPLALVLLTASIGGTSGEEVVSLGPRFEDSFDQNVSQEWSVENGSWSRPKTTRSS